ncbi:SCO family protein [Benzoatithermus flavus]|uniref:SCO family protein n=1 Tax=Benzoatithermus flavus TaxID=3108223 RepID=A0ABU8XP45_9PROT
MPRWLAAVLVALALIVAAALGWRFSIPSVQTTAQQQGTVPIGGPFSLVDQNGRRVTDQDFRGRFMLVYFGYTFCPDVCPLGLQTIAQAMDDLPQDVQDRVVPIFVTVDPARDTVEVMRGYVQAFHPKLVGLTGSEAEIGAALRAYRVYARKAEAKDGAYLVDHSTFTYLMDREGRYLAHFGHGTTPEEMAKRIADLVRAG